MKTPYIASLILGGIFLFAAGRVLLRQAPAMTDAAPIELRLAHYLVYDSNREFYDLAIAEYRKLHPDVNIVPIDVPPRIWPVWRQTRFTGDTAPDIIQLGRGFTDEMAALYLTPLSEELERPNPYNAGTALEGVAWGETFVDDSLTGENFNPRLLEHYGVSNYLNLRRVYFNVDLMREITGKATPPRDYAEFIAYCREVKAWSEKRRSPVVPIAGSIEYSRGLFVEAMTQQTQRLARRIDLEHDLVSSERETAMSWLRGEWALDDEALLPVWEQLHEMAQFFQPGFLQLAREDAGFLFKQGRAAMIVSGTWDANYFLVDSDFEVGVFVLPLPDEHHPRYGRNVVGVLTERAAVPSGALGVARSSKHPAEAIDFLRYLTSLRVNEWFAEYCLRVPVIEGAAPPPGFKAFAPMMEGYEPGATLWFEGLGSRSSQRHLEANIDYLVGPNGTVDGFLQRLSPHYGRYLRQDLQRVAATGLRTAQRMDAVDVALRLHAATTPEARRRATRLTEAQVIQEAENYQVLHTLSTTQKSP